MKSPLQKVLGDRSERKLMHDSLPFFLYYVTSDLLRGLAERTFFRGLTILFLALMLVNLSPKLPHAEAANCIGDYTRFIMDASSPKTRRATFKQAFTLNSCQINDVLAVEDALDTVRDSLRETAGVCGDTSDLKESYIQLLLERYFLQHIQTKKADYPSAEDAKALQDYKDELFTALESDMRTTFVNKQKLVSEDDFQSYFDGWKEKYSDRLDAYANCQEGPWAELTDTWNDFMKTINDLGHVKLGPKAPSTPPKENKVAVTGEVKQGLIDAWKSMEDLKNQLIVKNVPPQKTVVDVLQETNIISIGDALDTLEDDRLLTDISMDSQGRMARYTQLYGVGSATSTSQIQDLIDQSTLVVDEMTTTHLPQIAALAQQAFEKQCK